MKVTELKLPGLLLIETRRFGDDRGWFTETWQEARYREAGIQEPFIQDNLAYSRKGVLRGLHAQEPNAQGKLVQVFRGTVFDVAVDLRVGSSTFGRWHAVTLSGGDGKQFYLPPGFGHGYYVGSDEALFGYKCTDTYHPESQFSIRWDDPDIAIKWPLDSDPILSVKDANAPRLAEIPRHRFTIIEG